MTTNKLTLKHKKNTIFSTNKDTLSCYVLSIIILLLIIAIICNPVKYNSSILQGLQLFFISVLPGLFPFMFLTKLLTSLGAVKHLSIKLSPLTQRLFNTHGISSYVFIMSILSGYPIGAKLISDLYIANAISVDDSKKMCAFCTTSGPIFIIGSVGATMFGNVTIGVILYVSHILSSVICGIIFAGKRKKNSAFIAKKPLQMPDNLLGITMLNTVENILLVGAYITIFFLLADILADIGILKAITHAIEFLLSKVGIQNVSFGVASGLLEVTRGCKILSANPSIWSVCFTCAAISFSGLCIILQSMSFLNKCKIKARYFIGIKCVHAILAFVICFIICKLFNPF